MFENVLPNFPQNLLQLLWKGKLEALGLANAGCEKTLQSISGDSGGFDGMENLLANGEISTASTLVDNPCVYRLTSHSLESDNYGSRIHSQVLPALMGIRRKMQSPLEEEDGNLSILHQTFQDEGNTKPR
jgi:hypothetical protein